MAFVKVGVMALRAPSGEFLPEEPIYRDIQEPKKGKEYIPMDELAKIFADKLREYKEECRKIHKKD